MMTTGALPARDLEVHITLCLNWLRSEDGQRVDRGRWRAGRPAWGLRGLWRCGAVGTWGDGLILILLCCRLISYEVSVAFVRGAVMVAVVVSRMVSRMVPSWGSQEDPVWHVVKCGSGWLVERWKEGRVVMEDFEGGDELYKVDDEAWWQYT